MRERYERLRLWLACLLYGWACRLARQELAKPWEPTASDAFARLQAYRMERLARMWQTRYRVLRTRQLDQRVNQKVEF